MATVTDRSAPYRLLARSSTPFIQADKLTPRSAAARSYRAFRASLTRIVRYSRSPFSTAGLPRFFLGSSIA